MHRQFLFFTMALCAAAPSLRAQSISPVIAEYREHASGSFLVTNSSLVPMAVVLEPRSFSIKLDGMAFFRSLDPAIHLELSATSMRLEPKESATVFYKVSAAEAPVWLTVYATFTAVKPEPGMNVRIMLPHTIYVYQKEPLEQAAVHVADAHYDLDKHKIICELTNDSDRAGRADSIQAQGEHASAEGAGFPLLPHGTRRLTLDWTSPRPPRTVEVEFPRFTLKVPISETSVLTAQPNVLPLAPPAVQPTETAGVR